jgi:hypothetical protein
MPGPEALLLAELNIEIDQCTTQVN